MDDYDLVVRLGRSVGRPALVSCPVHTSARRYSKRGVILTTLLNQVSEKHDCIIFVLIVTATRYNALIIQVQALIFLLGLLQVIIVAYHLGMPVKYLHLLYYGRLLQLWKASVLGKCKVDVK